MQHSRNLSLACGLAIITLAAAASPANSADATAPATSSRSGIENSVVHIFTTVRYPDVYRPWAKTSPTEYSGTGVVIEGKRILSNSHLLLYASQVQVQANQAGDKFSATVEAISPEMDLAVLKVDDESFFDGHPALPRAKTLPDVKDVVMAYGFPEGGHSLSITKGIVSRVEFVPYDLSTAGLRIQVDAAINPGNSGGPAVVGDQMIGLVFSRLSYADNIGYIIPNEEIEIFLQDVADGRYDGKPSMYDDLQTFENPALRPFLKCPKGVEGIIVHKPYETNASYPLKEWDIITRIGDTPVDNEGMIKLDLNRRVRFGYLIQQMAKNGKVPLTIVRAGQELKIELPTPLKRERVLEDLGGKYPSYFIYGPLVFSPATPEFMAGLARVSSASRLGLQGSPFLTRALDRPNFPDEQMVVISSPFFPHKLVKGYSSPIGQVIKTVNGKPVKNLRHLVETLRDLKDEFLILEFDARFGETIVFPRAELAAATDEILTDNGIRSQGSADVMSVWNTK